MERRDTTDQLRKEHLEILRLTEKIQDALSLASREEFAARQKGLADLRGLHHGLLGICQHCGSEDGLLESEYHHHLDGPKYELINTQHQGIFRNINSFLRELPLVTADSVVDVVPRGIDLVDRIREHIEYEEEMLGYIESSIT
jgi:hemerythrin-like domain-containing protein